MEVVAPAIVIQTTTVITDLEYPANSTNAPEVKEPAKRNLNWIHNQ